MAAGEATGYANYDRWESGSTRVGPQHLAHIAVAFGLDGHELSLLVFAWLSDRFVPATGHRESRLELGVVRRWIAELPSALVSLGEFADLTPDAASSTEIALAYVLACYGERDRCGHWTLRVAPTPRTEPPKDVGPGLLDDLYGYAITEAVELLVELAGIGWEPNATDAERPLATAAVALLTHERIIDGIGSAAAKAVVVDAGGFGGRIDPRHLSVLGAVATLAPELSALGVRVRCEFRRLLESAMGHRVDYRHAERLLIEVSSGDVSGLSKVIAEAEAAGRSLAASDHRLTLALADMLERTVDGCHPYVVDRHGQERIDQYTRLVNASRETTETRRSA